MIDNERCGNIIKPFLDKNGNISASRLCKIHKLISKEDLEYLDSIYPNFDNPADYIRCIKFNIKERPRCPICGKYTSWATTHNYFTHCSIKCSKNDINVQNKMEQTCLEKYGVKNGGGSEQALQKIKETSIKHYGVENPYQAESIKEKIKNTLLSRYGVSNPGKMDLTIKASHTKETIHKAYLTKKKNHTFCSSKAEDIMYDDLCELYGKENILRQYKCDRYPYQCDFYISHIDCFIELQGFYSHGNHPFDENSEEDIKRVEYIKQYENPNIVLNVWCKSDIEKRNKAKENNLHYIEIFDYKKLSKEKIKELINESMNLHNYVVFCNK